MGSKSELPGLLQQTAYALRREGDVLTAAKINHILVMERRGIDVEPNSATKNFDMEPKPIYHHPAFDFDPEEGCLIIDGDVIPLVATQVKLLNVLIERENKITSNSVIAEALWEDYLPGDGHNKNIRVHVSKLRQKIKHGRDMYDPIVAIRGLDSYKLVNPYRDSKRGVPARSVIWQNPLGLTSRPAGHSISTSIRS